MNAYPFSVYKRADRSCFSVAFKDANGKYLPPVFTGKNENEAILYLLDIASDNTMGSNEFNRIMRLEKIR